MRGVQQGPVLVGGAVTESAEAAHQDAHANLPGSTFLIPLIRFAEV
jgi:hypothetical protein